MAIQVFRKAGHAKPALLGSFATQAEADACQKSWESSAGDPPAYEVYQEGKAEAAKPK